MDTKSEDCNESCGNSEKVGHLLTPPSTTSENSAGCGENEGEKITITVAPTTGGTFHISVQKDISVECLKKVISKKLKVPKERILLLHKERQLRDGSLLQNNVADGSTLTLLPSVETGLLSQRPEQTVMQALESLNDSQVNDFLSGKAPLNLTMRLGDHMMLIQLQLSSVTPSSSRKAAQRAAEAAAASASPQVPVPTSSPGPTADPADISLPNLSFINSKLNSLLHKNHENLNALKRKLIIDAEAGKKKAKSAVEKDCQDSSQPGTSRKSTKYCDIIKDTVAGQEPTTNKRSEILSQIMESVRRISENTQEMTQAIEGKMCEGSESPPCAATSCTCARARGGAPEAERTPPPPAASGSRTAETGPDGAALDTKALAEASRNLTQTLKQLSSEVLTCRPETTPEVAAGPSTSRRRTGTPGAIIESMQHHGKGVFSGTFSGTLNPQLQDRYGRPKRDISTIIHILNDLLCATPHYRAKSSSSKSSSANAQTSHASSTKRAEDTLGGEEDEAANENEATRGKLERLRMVMEQTKARRRARREGRHPWQSNQNLDMDADPAIDMESTENGDILEISPLEPVVA